MIIQNLINPALGTDVLSDNQIAKIKSIIASIKQAFDKAAESTPVEVEDVDDEEPK